MCICRCFYFLQGMPFLIIAQVLLPESPRWLQNQGHFKEAVETLKRIALGNNSKWSQRFLDDSSESESDDIEISIQPHLQAANSNDSLMDLFRNKYLMLITMIQIFSWMT